MPVSEAHKRATIEYAKKNLKRIPLDVQKEKYEEIAEAAASKGESVNGYIKKAIDARLSGAYTE
jgi:predicted HicB family RNase H-like nuclease